MVRALPIAGLLLLGASMATAQQGGHMKGMGGMGGGMALDDEHFQPTVERLTMMLGLTPEQAAQVTPFRDTLLAETRDLRMTAQQARDAMREGCQAHVGADSVAVLRQSAQAAMHALMPARLKFHERMKAVLTADQATKLDARHAKQMQQMQTRMQSGMGGGCGMMGGPPSGADSAGAS